MEHNQVSFISSDGQAKFDTEPQEAEHRPAHRSYSQCLSRGILAGVRVVYCKACEWYDARCAEWRITRCESGCDWYIARCAEWSTDKPLAEGSSMQ